MGTVVAVVGIVFERAGCAACIAAVCRECKVWDAPCGSGVWWCVSEQVGGHQQAVAAAKHTCTGTHARAPPSLIEVHLHLHLQKPPTHLQQHRRLDVGHLKAPLVATT